MKVRNFFPYQKGLRLYERYFSHNQFGFFPFILLLFDQILDKVEDLLLLIISQILYMKNSLQLQIQNLIKKGNNYFQKKSYFEAFQCYKNCVTVFQDHRKFNPSIHDFYLITLYSLLGLTTENLLRNVEAQSYYDQALHLYPYHSDTLYRRTKLFLKDERISQAIEDFGKISFSHPEDSEYRNLLEEIEKNIEKISDAEEKNRLKSNISSIFNIEEQDLNEQQALNFSSLKKIDKYSQANGKVRKHEKKCSFFKAESMIEDFNKLKQSNEIQQINRNDLSQNIVGEKQVHKQGKNKLSIIKKTSILSDLRQYIKNNQPERKVSALNSQVIKNIDGKYIEKNERDKNSKFVQFSEKQIKIQIHPKTESGRDKNERKSCLKLNSSFALSNSEGFIKRLSFSSLKNIDKFCKKQEKEQRHGDDEKVEINGEKYCIKEILNSLQNMMVKNLFRNQDGGGANRSILKKFSMIHPQAETAFKKEEERQKYKKKSVCFTRY